MRPHVPLIALAFALACAPAAPAPAADAAQPALTASADTLVADAAGMWSATFTLRDPLAWGLFPDSMFFEYDDGDAGETRAPRHQIERFDALVSGIGELSSHDNATFDWSSPQRFDRGRLTVRLHAHDVQHEAFVMRVPLVIAGSALADAHPSGFVRAGGRRVELLIVPAANVQGPAPAVLLAHAEHEHARKLLRQALALAARGYAVGLVSLPGYGLSEGEPDAAGPATIAAISAALDSLERSPGVDAHRVAVWGRSLGATAALLAATRRPELRGVIAEGANLDPWATWRAAAPDARRAFEAEAGRDSAAWRARSPVAACSAIRCDVLVLHGAADDQVPAAEAQTFGALRDAKQLPGTWRVIRNGRHLLSPVETQRPALDFLAKTLAP